MQKGEIMIDNQNNPYYLNDFLAYISTILNKSPNTVKEYNYDLNHFLKYIKYRFGLAIIDDIPQIKSIPINDLSLDVIEKITLQDIHSFLAYLKENYQSKPTTLSRKTASIRTFFQYLCNKTKHRNSRWNRFIY